MHVEIKQHNPKEQYVKEEVTQDLRKYPEMLENINIRYWNLQDTRTGVLTKKLWAINTHVRKNERFHVDDLT
jgi:hypothetical protein